MSNRRYPFLTLNPVSYGDVLVPSQTIAEITMGANEYLRTIDLLFKEIEFDIFSALGQRNLSGFIGEVFTGVFSNHVDGFMKNPHPDGRPDLIDLNLEPSRKFYQNSTESLNEGEYPDRSSFTPYPFGGLEVKCTIGTTRNGAKQLLKEKTGIESFEIGISRIDYVTSITYWGHHTSCENLIGLLYDYSTSKKGLPQIMAVMHSELNPESDWNKVSKGKPGSKKTSNTSLTKSGRGKLMRNPVVVVNEIKYIERLREIGLSLPNGKS